MAKVVVTKSKLDSLAQHINTKAGTTGAKTIAQMQATVDGISTKMSVTWHQCPEAVRNYLANVTYDPSDYSNSQIANYAPATPVVANTKPIGKTVGGVTYYNEVPNVETPFSADSAAGTLKPLDALRWIRTRNSSAEAWNVRDLGGWACDGGTVKYGLLIRGGRISAADRAVLVGQLGVQHEIDLRGKEGRDPSDGDVATESPLGSDVWFTIADKAATYALTPVATWQLYLRCIFDAVTHGQPVYFHCTAGADRTGTLACVLEGLLGMSQSDIDKDYELTTFYSGSGTDDAARRRNESQWKGLISAINAKSGSTFRDKCVTFAAELGFTAAEINAFRAAMIDGTPETVAPSIDTYTVTNTLTNATSDNSAVSATEYQPYTAKIAPTNGYVISSVQVKMGGVDVTDIVWSGTETVLRRKVTASLTNCTSDNGKKTVIDGQGYAATLTAVEGYTLDGATVTITMGGVDVSTFYKDGVIAIPNVTGDLEIAVTAVKSAIEIVNLVSVYGVAEGYRLSTSSGRNSAAPGWCAIGSDNSHIIPAAVGDVIRIKGAQMPSAIDNKTSLVWYSDFAGTLGASTYLHKVQESNYISVTDENGDGVVAITLKAMPNNSVGIRISIPCTDTSQLIVTKNQEIT